MIRDTRNNADRPSVSTNVEDNVHPGEPGVIGTVEHKLPVHHVVQETPLRHEDEEIDAEGNIRPTELELKTLRRVPVALPWSAYLMCVVSFAERASYFGCKQVFVNFIYNPLPVGGNGAGAPPPGTQSNAGALGQSSVVASAIIAAFDFLGYGLPLFAAYLADTRWGRFKTIVLGTVVFGIAHLVLIFGALPSVLQAGHAYAPFLVGVFMLAIGSAIFKPNINPIILDQNPLRHPIISTTESGERVIADPEATNDSVMLWFYLLLNIGGFMGVPTAYIAKYSGFWSAFLLPFGIFCVLPPVLWWCNKHAKKQPPGGSDLANVFKVLTIAMRKKGPFKIFTTGGLNSAKPSALAAVGDSRVVPWSDQFVDDVTRTFQACGIFLFYPIYIINDGGLGTATNAQSNAMVTNGVPNDVVSNLNSLTLICAIPLLNHVVYPLLRRHRIRWGPIARITTGLMFAAIGSVGWAIIQYYIYKTSPCGYAASSCSDDDGNTIVAPISVWFTAIPVCITALSEVFCNVTAYSVAYARSPPNMKALVMAINLFMTAIAAAISLGTSNIIQDPYLVWAFAGPSIVGFVLAIVFWFLFKHLNNEEYVVHLWDDALVVGDPPHLHQTNSGSEITDEEKHSYADEKSVDASKEVAI